MAPVYEELSREFANRVLFLKINTDHNPRSSGKYRIFSVPTFMLFNSGKRVAQRAGAAPKAKFKEWIEEAVKRVQ
jgi:thioredoxin 2